MRVLQIGKAYPPVNLGGVEVVIELLSEGLNRKGILCDALGVNDRYRFVAEPGKYGGQVFRTRLLLKAFSTLFSLQLITFLFRIQRNYDIVHVHSPDPMAAIAVFICRPKAKLVLHWHSDILKQKFLLFFYNPLLWWLVRRADLVVCTSPPYIDGSKYLSKYRNKTRVLPIGLDIPDFTELETTTYNFDGKKIVFSLGRLAYYKGFEYLVKAATQLPEDYIIVIAGEGNEREKLETIIKRYHLENKVKLLGKVSESEKEWLFRNCILFALSSIYKTEAYAIVQVEAMAYGVPVISTRIPGSGVDWVNLDGYSGLTVPVRDEAAIARAIVEITTDEKVYLQFRKNASARYTDMFTSDIMIEKQISIYKEIFKS